MPEPRPNTPLAVKVFELLLGGAEIIGRPVTPGDHVHIGVSLIVDALSYLPPHQRKQELQRVVVALRRSVDAMPKARPDA